MHDRADTVPLGQDREDSSALAQDTRVAPHKACTTVVSSPRKSRAVTEAKATPWSASGVTSMLMARSRRS